MTYPESAQADIVATGLQARIHSLACVGWPMAYTGIPDTLKRRLTSWAAMGLGDANA